MKMGSLKPLILLVFLAIFLAGFSSCVLAEETIGIENFEYYLGGINELQGFGNPNWNPGDPAYGGGDDGSFAMVIENVQCDESGRNASITFSSYSGDLFAPTKLAVRHLDGLSNLDSFNVRINRVFIGEYRDSQGSYEYWVTNEFDVVGVNASRVFEVEFEATDEIWEYCSEWGQLALSYVELRGKKVEVKIEDVGLLHENRMYLCSYPYQYPQCYYEYSGSAGYEENVSAIVEVFNYGEAYMQNLELDYYINGNYSGNVVIPSLNPGDRQLFPFSVIVNSNSVAIDGIVHLSFDLKNDGNIIFSKDIDFLAVYNLYASQYFKIYKINSTGGRVILNTGEKMIVGENYSIESEAMASGYEKGGKNNFSISFSALSDRVIEIGVVKKALDDGTIIPSTGIQIRLFKASLDFTLKKEYLISKAVTFQVFWNSDNKLEENDRTQSDNKYRQTYAVDEKTFDFAIKSIKVRNSSNAEINGYEPNDDKKKNNLTIEVEYANLGMKAATEEINLSVYVNTIKNPRLIYQKTIKGIAGNETNISKFFWSANIQDDNCPYGECTFFANSSILREDINISNNNFTRDFDVVKIALIIMGGYLPEYLNKTSGKFYTVRRNSEYYFLLWYSGRNATFTCIEPGNKNCTGINVRILPQENDRGYKIADVVVKNSRDSKIGFYKAIFSVGNDFKINREWNYSAIFDSSIRGDEYETYLYSTQNSIIKELNYGNRIERQTGRLSDFSFAYSGFGALGIAYDSEYEPYVLMPQSNKIFEMALSAVEGNTDARDAAMTISEGIIKTSNHTGYIIVDLTRSAPLKLKNISAEEFAKAANDPDFVFPDNRKMQSVCTDYSYVAVAMLRSIGIPARQTAARTVNVSAFGGHSWVEIYIPGIDNSDNWLALEPQNGKVSKRMNFPSEKYMGIITAKPNWKYNSLIRYIRDKDGAVIGVYPESYIAAYNKTGEMTRMINISTHYFSKDHYILDCKEKKYKYNESLCPK